MPIIDTLRISNTNSKIEVTLNLEVEAVWVDELDVVVANTVSFLVGALGDSVSWGIGRGVSDSGLVSITVVDVGNGGLVLFVFEGKSRDGHGESNEFHLFCIYSH